jgi:hypothetical protein
VPVTEVLIEIVGRHAVRLVAHPPRAKRIAVSRVKGQLRLAAEGEVVQRDVPGAEVGSHGRVLVRQQRSLHDLDVLLLDEVAGVGQRDRRVPAGVGEVRDDVVAVDSAAEDLEPEVPALLLLLTGHGGGAGERELIADGDRAVRARRAARTARAA